ncbi:MAG: Ig-like domain-containing protein [Chloroflexi bacterium]|nr:Ig-like domain-containing protein [Chloroflexota bacterium]
MRDASNIPIPGVSVTLTATGPAGVQVIPPTGVTDGNGNALFRLVAPVGANVPVTLNATANGVPLTAVNVTLTP